MERQFHQFLKIASIGLTLALTYACGPQIQTTVDTGGPTVQETITYEGPKARIGVPRFDCKAEKCGGDIGFGLSDMLSTALFKSGRFVVLERGEGLSEGQRELDLSESGYVDKSKAPRKGLMEGADVLVMGAITAFEPKASGTRAGGVVVPFNVPLLGGETRTELVGGIEVRVTAPGPDDLFDIGDVGWVCDGYAWRLGSERTRGQGQGEGRDQDLQHGHGNVPVGKEGWE